MANSLEKRLTLLVMREEIPYEKFASAIADQHAFKFDTKGLTSLSKRVTHKVKTSRRVVQWVWYLHRTPNGYFIGWRETYTRDGVFKKDQFTARRVKKRLVELQMSRYEELLTKPGSQMFKWNALTSAILK